MTEVARRIDGMDESAESFQAKPRLELVHDSNLKQKELVSSLVAMYKEDIEGAFPEEVESFVKYMKEVAATDENEAMRESARIFLEDRGETI